MIAVYLIDFSLLSYTFAPQRFPGTRALLSHSPENGRAKTSLGQKAEFVLGSRIFLKLDVHKCPAMSQLLSILDIPCPHT